MGRFLSRLPESVTDAYGMGRVRSEAADADRRWLLAFARTRKRKPQSRHPAPKNLGSDEKALCGKNEFSEVVQGK